MSWNWKEHRKKKNQFRSYYCVGCRQRKPCGILTKHTDWQGYCCQCYFRSKQAQTQEYSNYQLIYQQKVKEWQERFQQLQLLKSYGGCSQCGSLVVDFNLLDEEKKLTCSYCLVAQRIEKKKKSGGGYPIEVAGSHPISFSEKLKWYKKHWGIDLNEWLKNFSQLPINYKCANKWLKDKNHLNNCQCLEQDAQELVEFYNNLVKEMTEKLKECQCEASHKTRTFYYDISNYGYTHCERCEKEVKGAGKHGVIKNRNDPRFWGLSAEEKVLCGDCLESEKGRMTATRRAEFNRYRKVKRL